ncbi:MAG: hypothetical protein Q4E64_00915 [Phascolarctobacterium sp.]|uniref:hypothetical protein n=1 Tax=Phascolarctobacterium sp. TaxID=2049039 RepID=UPI0026DDC78A|nr:hypothetical protein [Phascolarctobacterium sp.]MDO4920380.1 hypothetical protein [Phascolarctobacterium sp.]
MDQLEWQGYVHRVATYDCPIPLSFINDYNDWKCRSTVGRMLLILKDVEGAMAVLATVKDVQPDMEDAPDFGLSEAEHKVLCLRDIAQIVWDLTGTADAPLVYLREAYKLCRDYKHVFRSADRGKIWVRRLELLRSCGREEKALAEAAAMLEQEKDNAGVNPYRFRALVFMAESLAAQGAYEDACAKIAEAYQSFPLTEAAERDLAAAAAQATPEERYAAYLHCTTIQYQPWERDNVPTLAEVRKLQEDNFRRRQASEQGGLNAADLIGQLK